MARLNEPPAAPVAAATAAGTESVDACKFTPYFDTNFVLESGNHAHEIESCAPETTC